MRIAIVSDIHDNRTAFDAVLADLRATAPDLILHGGDLVHGGSSPIEILDHVRDLGWPGVLGNTDEMLFRPEALANFASRLPQLATMFAIIEEMAAHTRDQLGPERLAWLAALPTTHIEPNIALVHATPASTWTSILATAPDADLESAFTPLEQPITVYAHIHCPYVRELPQRTVINTGSVGLPHDGDPRASYLILDNNNPTIRRVEYDLDKELKALAASKLPHSDWVAKILSTARPQMP
jgi:putative phosphoesterase